MTIPAQKKTIAPLRLVKPALPLVSIVIPTMHRPKQLKIALTSAAIQTCHGFSIEIIVADNSPAACAREYVAAFATTTKVPVKYISAPTPGVANVRNAALSQVSGQYIAFLDDDQQASHDWLSHMMSQCKKSDAAAVFARIEGLSTESFSNEAARLDFFSRHHDGKPSGITTKFYGCGASLVDLSKVAQSLLQFDEARNETGGEDDAFFNAIEQAGGTFAWSQEAYVHEIVPPARMKKSYICQRSFAFGQGPSSMCLEPGSRSMGGLLRWMIIGAGQMGVYLPLALITAPLNNSFHMKCLRKGCEGMGKFFWCGVFRPHFYGQAAVNKTAKLNS